MRSNEIDDETVTNWGIARPHFLNVWNNFHKYRDFSVAKDEHKWHILKTM